MADYAFHFDGGSSLDHGLTIIGRHFGSMPVSSILQSVPGRAGAYVMGDKRDVRTVSFSVDLDTDSLTDAQSRLHEIAAWLTTASPRALTLDDDPGKTYNAKFEGTFSPDGMGTLRQGEIVFTLADPFAYALTETEMPLAIGENPVSNHGGVDAFPREEIVLAGPTNCIRVTGPSAYVQVGQPADATQTGTDPEPLSFHDDCSDANGWTPGTVTEGGPLAGIMTSNGSSLSPKHSGGSFGDPTVNWHGPALGKTLTADLTDFKVDAWIALDDRVAAQMGKAEVYFLNAAGAVLGKMDVTDAWAKMAKCVAYFRAGPSVGGHTILSTSGSSATGLVNFYGLLRVQRVANMWTVTVSKCNATTRVPIWRKRASWYDAAGTFGAALHRVEIRGAQYSNYAPTATLAFDEVNVSGITAGIPAADPIVIGTAGDVFTIDHYSAEVRKNGELFMRAIDFGSTFFPIGSGDTTVSLDVDGSITSASAFVRERWL